MVKSEKRNAKIIRLPMKILTQWICLNCFEFFTSKKIDSDKVKCTYCNSDSFFWDEKFTDMSMGKKSKKQIREIVFKFKKKGLNIFKKFSLKELNKKIRNIRESKRKYLITGNYEKAAKCREAEKSILDQLNKISQKSAPSQIKILK